MQNPNLLPSAIKRRHHAIRLVILAIGPGVLGLAADNDAGGLLSYVVTGAAHHLLWFIPALWVMAPVTYMIQELALRVAFATQQPFGQVLRRKFGPSAARVNGLILHALNLVILVTEFLGMALGLRLMGIPWSLGVILAWALVLAVTSWSPYQSVERLLLWVSLVNLIFIPITFLLHPDPHAWSQAFGGGLSAPIGFLMLSLAGNAMAPWMIYWQQNAVWAGKVRTLKVGRQDILLGVIAQVVMATVVLLVGALTPHQSIILGNPIQWIAQSDGRLIGDLFALGIFNAGFLAACTISLASAWMVREAWAPGTHARQEMPTRGGLFVLHLITLGVAAAAAIFLIIPAGSLALWAQALGALWLPVSLGMLGMIARDRRMMGPMAIRWRRQLSLSVVIVLFLGLALVGIFGTP